MPQFLRSMDDAELCSALGDRMTDGPVSECDGWAKKDLMTSSCSGRLTKAPRKDLQLDVIRLVEFSICVWGFAEPQQRRPSSDQASFLKDTEWRIF